MQFPALPFTSLLQLGRRVLSCSRHRSQCLPKRTHKREAGPNGQFHQEMTALGIAALEASERPDQKGAVLESGTVKAYPGALRLVCEEEFGWVGSPALPAYTKEDSMLNRTHGGGF